MTDFKKPSNSQEYQQNFDQLHPIMNATQAHYESSRCLFCHDAPCIQACPTGIDIPLFIKQINTKNVSGAANTIYESNWLGNICGKVCPTEVLCEGACVYNHQDVKPIEIGRLQSYACTHAIDNGQRLVPETAANGSKIAIVGAGPAGISAACELCALGYTVEIFEAKEQPSGLALYGVAPYKITNESVIEEIDYLQQQFGFKIQYLSKIESAEDFADLEKKFQAIVIATGLGNTRDIDLPGEDLPGCIGAVEFIENLKIEQHQSKIGEKVIVLGGGNTAMDAASEACRMGAEEVLLAYRRGYQDMRAYHFEYRLAKSVGAKGLWNASPLAIEGTDKVTGVRFARTVNDNGRLTLLKDQEFVVQCDMVIKATGQNKQTQLLKNIPQLQLDQGGRISVVNEYFQTHNPKYFTAGDALNGGKEVVNAVAEAKLAARGIHHYLTQS